MLAQKVRDALFGLSQNTFVVTLGSFLADMATSHALWYADIHVGPVSDHCLHGPLPEVVPTLVLRSLEMDLRRVERQCGGSVTEAFKRLLHPGMQCFKRLE